MIISITLFGVFIKEKFKKQIEIETKMINNIFFFVLFLLKLNSILLFCWIKNINNMQTVQIPLDEYDKLIVQNRLLQQSELLQQINQVLDLMYESKYGLYLGDYTEDLTEYSINEHFDKNERKQIHSEF